jgi:hemerythrin-like metal-binding protein
LQKNKPLIYLFFWAFLPIEIMGKRYYIIFQGGMVAMIKWTPDLAVGVKTIDEQHQELFRRFNQLLEACTQGQGKEAVGKTLQFLDEYVITHFGNEETYMLSHGYPEYTQHKAAHTQFINTLKQLRESFGRGDGGITVVIQANQVVVDWLNNHIRKVDTKLGAFLAGKM